jgi:hypothetical protein
MWDLTHCLIAAGISSWDMGHRQLSKKQCFIVLTQTQWTCVQKLIPRNKEVSPYIPLQAGYRSKKQSSPHIWLHVTSLAISFPQCCVTFMFQFFKFYLSALLFWSSFLLYHSPLWCLDPPRAKEHHLGLGVCIFIAPLYGWLFCSVFVFVFCFYSGLHNGPDRPQYQGSRQGNLSMLVG